MEEEEPMRLNLACIYHYIKLAYFSYAYTAPGMFFVDLSHTNVLRTCDCFRENLLTLVFVILCGDVFKISIKCFIKYIIYILEAQNTFCLSERDVEIHKVFVIFTRGIF